MDGILVLLAIFVFFGGIIVLTVWLLSKAGKAITRATRNHQIEQQLRQDIADAEATERIARKLMRERGL